MRIHNPRHIGGKAPSHMNQARVRAGCEALFSPINQDRVEERTWIGIQSFRGTPRDEHQGMTAVESADSIIPRCIQPTTEQQKVPGRTHG